MRFLDRKEFLYDETVFQRSDSKIALGIYDEFVTKHSPIPRTKFFEVDRGEQEFDALWGVTIKPKTTFTVRSPLEIPALHTFERPDWRLSKIGQYPQRKDNVCLSNLSLQRFNWFPVRGDRMFFNGYRYMIINVVIPPDAYWGNSNVWLGLNLECTIAPEEDSRPSPDLSIVTPAQTGQTPPFPLPEI